MSSPRGTFVRIRATDHAQAATPTMRTTRDAVRTADGGPPIAKKPGKATLRIRPTIRNGSVNSPIRSPLPTRTRRLVLAERADWRLLMNRANVGEHAFVRAQRPDSARSGGPPPTAAAPVRPVRPPPAGHSGHAVRTPAGAPGRGRWTAGSGGSGPPPP